MKCKFDLFNDVDVQYVKITSISKRDAPIELDIHIGGPLYEEEIGSIELLSEESIVLTVPKWKESTGHGDYISIQHYGEEYALQYTVSVSKLKISI